MSPSWDDPIARGLADMLERTPSEPAPIAAFDWDETCMRGDISETWLAYLDESAPGSLAAYEAGCRADRRQAYEQLAVDLVRGRSELEVRAAVDEAYRRAVREGRMADRPPIRELMEAMRGRGWEVWIVTASPAPVVRALAAAYGVAPDRVLGMTSPSDAAGRYLPSLTEPVTYREGKIRALLERTGRPPTFAAGDSEGDLWLLRAARYPLVIDRGQRSDPALIREATEAGWWIQRGWG